MCPVCIGMILKITAEFDKASKFISTYQPKYSFGLDNHKYLQKVSLIYVVRKLNIYL